MRWLRLGWLVAIGCALVVGAGSALVMRFELLDPGPTLTIERYGFANSVHGFVMLCAMAGVLAAMPTLTVAPTRRSVALGAGGLAAWGGAAVLVVQLASEKVGWDPPSSPSRALMLLGASLAAGAGQLALGLTTRSNRDTGARIVVAVAMIVSIVIVAFPLVLGRVPDVTYWLIAAAGVAFACIVDEVTIGGGAFAWFVIAPSVVLAWSLTALLRSLTRDVHVLDTVAILSPLPALGAALLGALAHAVTRMRLPRRGIAHVGAMTLTIGAAMTSIGFVVLGSRGMPRRYWQYMPEYQTLQVLLGVAAALTVLGFVITVVAFVRGTTRA